MALKKDYFKKFFDFSNPLNTFIGLVELLSEVSKLLSFSFRLFGNIFAGEMLLVVITGITYGIMTLPFLGLELFVGVIQAFVFFMLTTVFISVATTKQH
jgi:F-type H+-transporting ATPase subunit a